VRYVNGKKVDIPQKIGDKRKSQQGRPSVDKEEIH
jgi:hypothetical protein